MNSYRYIYNENIELLENDLGLNGENLTIVILTYNKSILTIRLLNSIKKHFKNFNGNVLLFDNNSDKTEKIKLKKYFETYPIKGNIYYSKKNLGIAGGRAKAFSLVKTDWILSLDNDMYFIKNPIKDLNECINKLGARFINLPAYKNEKKELFINGGKFRIINEDLLYVTASTFDKKVNYKIYFSTFIFGGSSLLNKYSYNLIGGYDNNFFVGYEDVDLSIRCYRAGIKVANISKYTLVHEHLKFDDNLSKKYEKVRYNYKNIMKSVDYFSKKYNGRYTVLTKSEKAFLDRMNGG